MRPIVAIAWRELRSYFVSPVAYVVTIVFLIIVTIGFKSLIDQFIAASLPMGLPGMVPARRSKPSITEFVLFNLFVPGIFRAVSIVVPFISMRLLSEDRRQGTADLLLSSPITTLQLVLGKYLGALVFMTILFGLTLHIPFMLVWRANADAGVAFAGYVGLFLAAAMYLAAGTFASALTENQIVAAVLGFGLVFVIFFAGMAAQHSEHFLGGVLMPFSLQQNLEDFRRGVLDSSGFVYFLSMSAFFIFLTQRTIDSQRWR